MKSIICLQLRKYSDFLSGPSSRLPSLHLQLIASARKGDEQTFIAMWLTTLGRHEGY